MMHRLHNKTAALLLFAQITLLISSCTGTSSDYNAQNVPNDYYITGTGSATLSWEAPMENTDNTNLDNLTGYIVYFGPVSGTLAYSVNVTNPNAITYIIENLRTNTQYMFAMTAINSDGVESDLSNIVTKMITE
ncbi:MAG TPA: fibronectin type III domain-containing protein [Gammaproteobacteria bacterium]